MYNWLSYGAVGNGVCRMWESPWTFPCAVNAVFHQWNSLLCTFPRCYLFVIFCVFAIFFLNQSWSCFYDGCEKIMEISGFHAGNNRSPCLFLQCLSRNSRNFSASFRNPAAFFKPAGWTAAEISFVEVSASIFKTNSVVLILSRRFSFFSPFRDLYCLVDIPAQALVISSVNIAYSFPCCTPRFCHSSVSSFRTRIVKSL